MLGDVGIHFAFKGGREALTWMQRLKGEYGALSSSVDRGAKRIGTSFTGMSGAIKAGAAISIAAIGALTAAAVAIPIKFAKMRTELTNIQADLRALGKTDRDIAAWEEYGQRLSERIAGVTTKSYNKAAYDTASGFSALTNEQQARINDIALITGRTTKMSAEEATDYFASIWSALPKRMKKGDPGMVMEEWAGKTQAAVRILKTTGPKLRAAMKHALSMLLEANWKPAEIEAFLGKLSETLSGEATGTVFKQLALKERSGFGKLLAMASGKWQDTEFLSGKAKTRAEYFNKGMIEEASKIGAKLFRTDPVKWLERMGTAFDKLKASGADYKKIMGQIFGEEPVNALIQLFETRGEMSGIIREIEKSSYKDVTGRVQEMNKGIGPQLKLLAQRWENLWETMGRTYEPTTIGWFQQLGSGLMKLNALWKALFTNTDPIDAIQALDRAGGESLIVLFDRLRWLKSAIPGFMEGIESGFSGAFAGMEGASAMLDRVVAALEKPDAEKWRKIGNELGRIAGTPLADLIKSLQQIKQMADEIWSKIKPAVETISRWTGKAEAEHLRKSEAAPSGWSISRYIDQMTKEDQARIWGDPRKGSHIRDYQKWTGPRAPDTRRMAPYAASPAGGQASVNMQPQINLEQTIEARVRVGDRELSGVITEIVKREMSRRGMGAGDSFVDVWN